MKRLALVLVTAISLWLPRVAVAAHAAQTLDPAQLRLPSDAFRPATLLTDEVESNSAASANYIGTHHPVSYDTYGRIGGYYERAAYQDVAYLRYLASVFPDAVSAASFAANSAGWASTHFVGPAGAGVLLPAVNPTPDQLLLPSFGGDCEGDADADDQGPPAEQGAPASPGDHDVTCTPNLILPPANCSYYGAPGLAGPQGAAADLNCDFVPTGVGANSVPCQTGNDGEDLGVAPITIETPCPPAPTAVLPCESDADTDDNGFPACTVPASDLALPVLDCTAALQAPCSLLGLSFIASADGTSWDELYGILQIDRCVAEVTVTAGSSYALRAPAVLGAQFANILTSARQVLQASCVS